MLKIWGRDNSNNVRKVLWCAEEAGLRYTRIDAGGPFGQLDQPEFLARNPNGLIPVIEDGALLLWESNAIVRYLSATYAAGSLYPEHPARRAVGDKWMDWTSSSFAPAFATLFIGLIRTAPEQRDPQTLEAARLRCCKLLELAERVLGEQAFLSGGHLAMGDIPLGCFIHAWFALPMERPPQPNLQAWYGRLCQRPAYAKVIVTALS
jgi:glutathione S-transferase